MEISKETMLKILDSLNENLRYYWCDEERYNTYGNICWDLYKDEINEVWDYYDISKYLNNREQNERRTVEN